jgi:hypothetical protein
MANYKLCCTGNKWVSTGILQIYKDVRLKNDYSKFYKPRTCVVMQKKAWMTYSCSKTFYFSSKSLFQMKFFNQFKLNNYRWPWQSCNPKCNITRLGIWIKYDHFTHPYISCPSTLRCFLFYVVQNNI